jgi:hypothetical protein
MSATQPSPKSPSWTATTTAMHAARMDWPGTRRSTTKKNPPPSSGETKHRTRTWIHDTLNACISFILNFLRAKETSRGNWKRTDLTLNNERRKINVLNFLESAKSIFSRFTSRRFCVTSHSHAVLQQYLLYQHLKSTCDTYFLFEAMLYVC